MQRTKLMSIAITGVRIGLLVLVGVTVCWPATKEQLLYSFKGSPDGGNGGEGGLIRDKAGNLYAVTLGGGTGTCASGNGCGTVFELTPGSNGQWTEQVLHSFNHDGSDGFYPNGPLVMDSAGNLYGTTFLGGTGFAKGCQSGCGTVFELSPGANGQWTEQVLYSFLSNGNSTDAWIPLAGLIFDAAGNLYGTTNAGGTGGCNGGCGTVFELIRAANGQWTEKLLYSFRGSRDGLSPRSVLVFDQKGSLYGTTVLGGGSSFCPSGCGTIFELTPGTNGHWTETVLHRFGTDAQGPRSTLILDQSGNLYGATAGNGSSGNNYGTIFELILKSNNTWAMKVLHRYTVKVNGIGGPIPDGPLVFDAAGNLYGTAVAGGTFSRGSVFKLLPGANGSWTYTSLYSFTRPYGDGIYPNGGVILDNAGNLYGVTGAGSSTTPPACKCGTVFELTP